MSGRKAFKYNGTTINVKKFLKCFDEKTIFIALTDKESEDDEDYVTGMNDNILLTTPENFLGAVNHNDVPNTTYRKVKGFPAKAEIFVSGNIYRASKVQLMDPISFAEAPFLADEKFYKYMHYEYSGASYLIKNDVPLHETFMKHLLKKDDNLISLLKKPNISELVAENPHRIRFFMDAEDVVMETLKKEPYIIQYIKEPTEEQINLALSLNGLTLRFVGEPTEEQCIIALNNTYMALQYVPKKMRTKGILSHAQDLLKADKGTNIVFDTLL